MNLVFPKTRSGEAGFLHPNMRNRIGLGKFTSGFLNRNFAQYKVFWFTEGDNTKNGSKFTRFFMRVHFLRKIC